MLIKICESKERTRRAKLELLYDELKRGIPMLLILVIYMCVRTLSKFQITIMQYYKLVQTWSVCHVCSRDILQFYQAQYYFISFWNVFLYTEIQFWMQHVWIRLNKSWNQSIHWKNHNVTILSIFHSPAGQKQLSVWLNLCIHNCYRKPSPGFTDKA